MSLARILLCIILILSAADRVRGQVNLSHGLIAYYPFDGNANDVSGNNNNPVFNNATLTTDRFGNANRAYYFNGTSNYMRVPNSPSLNPSGQISTCAWVKPMGFNAGKCHENSMFIKGDADALPGNYLLRFGDAQYTKFTNCTKPVDTSHENFSTNFGGVSGGFAPYITSNQWYLVIATYDGDTAKLFVNCNLVAKFAVKNMSLQNSYDLYIGKMKDPSYPYWLKGALDDIRIYNRALTQDEINALGSCQAQTEVTPSFTIPDTVCVNSPVNIVNTTTGANSYYWNFCNADFSQNKPNALNIEDPGDLNGPVFSDFAYEDGKYYGFIVNNYSGTLTRLDFGSNILNASPVAVNLGSVGGKLKVNDEGIQVVKNNGKWYAFVVGGDPDFGTNPHLVKIEFGDKITNTPIAMDWGNLGDMYQPVDLYIFQDGTDWYGYTVNAKNNTVTRFAFSNDFTNPPVASNLGNPGGYLNYPTGICAVNDNGYWRVFITNGYGNNLTRLDFGSTLLNDHPTAYSLGNPGNLLNAPRDFAIIKSCGGATGFAVNGPPNSDLIRYDFHGDLSSVPDAVSLGTNGGLDFPHSLSKFFRVGPDVYSFITNVSNNTITRLKFAGCTNSSIPSSTLKNPAAIAYSTPGVYNINLTIDDSLPTQNSLCKQVVVLAGPTLSITGDTTICIGDTSHLKVEGGSSYAWLGAGLIKTTGAVVSAIPDKTTQYFVTGKNSFGCAAKDSITVKADTCAVTCNANPDFSYTQSPCQPSEFIFNNETKNVSSVSWDFGNGQKAGNNTNPSVVYNSTGVYPVKLVVTTTSGCTDSIIKNIAVSYSRGNIVATHDTLLCQSKRIQLAASPALSYCWTPSTGLSATDIANPVASLTNNTTYFVNARVTDNNLIVNGDFAQGNTGFTSAYSYAAVNTVEGQYFVGTDPGAWNISMEHCTDHTNGKGKMLMINGDPQANINVWAETIAVEPNTNYAFSVWIESIFSKIYAENPAQLQFSINGKTIGNIFNGELVSCDWRQFFVTWNSGDMTTAEISIINKNTSVRGNDFALDDISFAKTRIIYDSVTIKLDSASARVSADTTICSGGSAQLTAKISPNTTYSWSPAQGLNDSTVLSPVASPTATTTYTLKAVSNVGCKASASIKIDVLPQPTVKTIPDSAICSGLSITLTTSVTNGNSYSWSPSGSLSDASRQNPVATPTANTQYIITVNPGTQCAVKDTANISVKPAPVVQASGDTTLCAGASSQITAVAQGTVSYNWSPSSGLSDPLVYNPVASPSSSTVYTVSVTANNNCKTNASVTITVNPQPVFSVTPTSKQICTGDQLTLNASGGDLYQWYPSATAASPTSSSTLVTPSVNTTYNVIITNSVCKITDTVSSTITVQQKPSVTITKSNDLDCVLGSATLKATGGTHYTWTPSTGLDHPNIATPLASPLQTTTYYVLVGNNGCSVKDSITLNVLTANAENGYKMPSAFTPNSDGNNDCFGLRYWGGVKTLEFEVYNRWGNRIFYTTDPSKCWDGTFKGLPQMPGTYVYQIKATTICGNVYRKGTVVLIR